MDKGLNSPISHFSPNVIRCFVVDMECRIECTSTSYSVHGFSNEKQTNQADFRIAEKLGHPIYRALRDVDDFHFHSIFLAHIIFDEISSFSVFFSLFFFCVSSNYFSQAIPSNYLFIISALPSLNKQRSVLFFVWIFHSFYYDYYCHAFPH